MKKVIPIILALILLAYCLRNCRVVNTANNREHQAFALGCRVGYVIHATGGSKGDVDLAINSYPYADSWLKSYLESK